MSKTDRDRSNQLPTTGGAGLAPVFVGALGALGEVGKSLENIARLNFETQRLRVDIASVRAQGRVIEKQIDASLSVALGQLEERRLNLLARARTLEELFKPGRISLQQAVKATQIYGQKVSETRPDDPNFLSLVDTHKFFYSLISKEANQYADRVERALSTIQTQISSMAVPRLNRPSPATSGGNE